MTRCGTRRGCKRSLRQIRWFSHFTPDSDRIRAAKPLELMNTIKERKIRTYACASADVTGKRFRWYLVMSLLHKKNHNFAQFVWLNRRYTLVACNGIRQIGNDKMLIVRRRTGSYETERSKRNDRGHISIRFERTSSLKQTSELVGESLRIS